MNNVLGDDKKQLILALGRLDWSLRRIQEATGARRERDDRCGCPDSAPHELDGHHAGDRATRRREQALQRHNRSKQDAGQE